MNERERLIELLRHSIAADYMIEPLADYLLDNGVVVPVRCRECVHCHMNLYSKNLVCRSMTNPNIVSADNFCKYGERRADNGT